MNKLVLIFCLSLSGHILAQGVITSEQLKVIHNKPISFVYDDVQQLLSTQKISNAFELRLNSGNTSVNVYAQVVFNNPAATGSFSNHLALQLTYTNSFGRVNHSQINLSGAPVLLFTQPANPGQSSQQIHFIYDLLLKPFTQFVKAEDALFSIVFTISPA